MDREQRLLRTLMMKEGQRANKNRKKNFLSLDNFKECHQSLQILVVKKSYKEGGQAGGRRKKKKKSYKYVF